MAFLQPPAPPAAVHAPVPVRAQVNATPLQAALATPASKPSKIKAPTRLPQLTRVWHPHRSRFIPATGRADGNRWKYVRL